MRLNEMQLFSTPVAQETIPAGDVPLTVSTFNSSETTIKDCVNQYIKYSDSSDKMTRSTSWIWEMSSANVICGRRNCRKSNHCTTLASMGTGFDCASKEEIAKVLSLGVSPDRIVFAHTCKPRSHVIYAAKCGVKMTTFDNEPELHKMKRLYPEAQLILRIRADDPMALVNLGCKFGAHLPEAKRLLGVAKELQLNVIGVSFHVGSVCGNPTAYAQAVRWSKEVFNHAATLGLKLKLLDLGGGFPGRISDPINFQQVVDEVKFKPALEEHFPPSSGVRIISEPGRFFVASALTLCLNITAKRVIEPEQRALNDEGPKFMYYVNDGVYGSLHCMRKSNSIVNLKIPPHVGLSEDSILHCASLWGPTCDGIDCITPKCYLPEMEIGQWLYLEDMGAYTNSVSSDFNGFARPLMVYVSSREDFAQLRRGKFNLGHGDNLMHSISV